MEGGRPHGAGGGHDVVKVLPHVPRVDGPAPPREYARSPLIAGGGEGNVCCALKEPSYFLFCRFSPNEYGNARSS